MGSTKVPTLQELGWTKQHYDAAQSAYQGFYRGRKRHSEDYATHTRTQLKDGIDIARGWRKSYRQAAMTGRLMHPTSGKLVGEWPVTDALVSNFKALVALSSACQKNLERRLAAM
jgi:hypothetical protein